LTGKLISLHTAHTGVIGDLLTEGNSADSVAESKSRVAGSATLSVVGETSTNTAYAVAEGEGSKAGTADSVGVHATELLLLAVVG
jgi:hypothetical protein